MRYPQDLFNVQRGLLAQYHISDPIDAYNGRGKWQVPQDPFGGGIQPSYYVLADDPTTPDAMATSPEFQLTTPMTVPGSNASNLASYISVNSDPGPDYGKLTVLQVPTKAAIDGPGQVANDFKNTPQITKDIQQFSNGQSNVIHGNLLTLPIGNSFLYVEPLYVQSTGGGTAFPTLVRVLVDYGGHVGYAADLKQALLDITEGRQPGASLPTQDSSSGGSDTTGSPATNSPTPSSSTSTPATGSSSSTSNRPATIAGVTAALGAAESQLQNPGSLTLNQIQALVTRIQHLSAQLATLEPSTAPSSTPKATSTP